MSGKFRVFRTEDRSKSHGDYVIRLNAELIRRSIQYVVVTHGKYAAIARALRDRELAPDICHLDQTIRVRLGVKAIHELQNGEPEFYVEIYPLAKELQSRGDNKIGRKLWNWLIGFASIPGTLILTLIKPKKLMLRLRLAPLNDAEKNIAVTSPENLGLVGIEEGRLAKISVAVKDPDGTFKLRKISRVLVGRTSYETTSGIREDLSMREVLRLDLDGRRELGFTSRELSSDDEDNFVEDYPIILQADMWNLFSSRFVSYGVTLFVAFLAINSLFSQWNWNNVLTLIVTLSVAALLTLIVVWFDLKARVHY